MKKKSINKKLDEILRLERLQVKLEQQFKELEQQQITEEKELKGLEKRELKNLKDIEAVEKEIRAKVTKKPLGKITYKDLGKATIGAFIGLVSHFTILEGAELAEFFSATKATSFLILSYLVGMIILYYTGFRKVKTKKFLAILPIRLTIIYLVTIAVITATLAAFSLIHSPDLLYKQVAAASLPAIIGACAADLIGESE